MQTGIKQHLACIALVVRDYQAGGRRDHSVEEVLTDALGWTGNGEVEGGETQPGRMNVFCRVMDPDIALRTFLEVLDDEELLEGAFIALVREGEEPRVLWPQDYPGPFRV